MTTDPHWEYLSDCMLEALDGNPAEQERILHGDLASIRAALKGKGGNARIFEGMGDIEFAHGASYARFRLERISRAWRTDAGENLTEADFSKLTASQIETLKRGGDSAMREMMDSWNTDDWQNDERDGNS